MSLLSRLAALILFALLSLMAAAQSGKAFFKEAEKLREEQQFEKALEKYGLALAIEPGLLKAYQSRADVYGSLGRMTERARDLAQAARLDRSEPDYAVAAAQAYMDMDSAQATIQFCDQALLVAPNRQDALMLLARACLETGNLDRAQTAADQALAVKATTDSYYLHGIVRTATRDYKTAEFDLDKVLEWNPMYEPAYVAVSEVQLSLYELYSGPTMKVRTLEKAIEKCTRALELNPMSTDALFVRSKALAYQKEYAKAIDDVSHCMSLGRSDRDVYVQRALYYRGFGQYQNAINDINHVVVADPRDSEALLLRASCRESNLDLEGALKDLDAAQKVLEQGGTLGADRRKELDADRARIAQQVFEMNRESDPPSITVVEPFRMDDVVQVSTSLAFVKVSGHVRDKSLLRSITVNGKPADFSAEEKDPEFVISVPLAADAVEIIVQATDVYENFSSEVLRVERSEGVAPTIAITAPDRSGERQITLPAGKNDLFLEGTVSDASLIRLVAVNGVNASYALDRVNPDFSIKVDLKDRDNFVVRAEDQYGNAAEVTYSIVRKAEPIAVVKPDPKPPDPSVTRSGSTGTTWVIHVDNGAYRNFPVLQGTSDAAKMQKVFPSYIIQRTISKKNLTKEQMERFFNIELRDLIRTNKVNTILVWYTGHGRTVGGKAYWIPVDGRKDDIYSFYNYGSLKAQMQNYSESVGNTVVVSDAAGGEDSFYELTR